MANGFIKTLYYSSIWCKLVVISTIVISDQIEVLLIGFKSTVIINRFNQKTINHTFLNYQKIKCLSI